MTKEIPNFIADLLDPEVYPEPTRRVEFRQTHASYILLTDKLVYKVKKAINLGFLDYRDNEVRHQLCIQEVLLNRRISPTVYLDVAPIFHNGPNHTHTLIPPHNGGQVVEWAVRMRRLPESRCLDRLVPDGKFPRIALEALAERLADFHAWAPQNAEAEKWSQADQVARNARENLEALQTMEGDVFEPQELELQRHTLERDLSPGSIWDQLHQRVLDRHYCDGHGDLRLEHIFLMPSWEFEFIDCIEFSARFRCGDVAADVAFIAMDLLRHRRLDLAEQFLSVYATAMDDHGLYRVVDFYIRYRALVRAKIEGILSQEEEVHPVQRRHSAQLAKLYLGLADSTLDRPNRGAVIATTGMIGSGKSTLAEAISVRLRAPLFNLDRIRKRIAGRPLASQESEGYEQGIYTLEFTEQAYRAMLERAKSVIESGRPVILDASFRKPAHRALAKELAHHLKVPFFMVRCLCPRDLLLKRLNGRSIQRVQETERQSAGGGMAHAGKAAISEGRREILESFEQHYDPPREIPQEELIVADTTQCPGLLARQVAGELRRRGLPG